jgi:outer membrane murein-binding lipoprotein Lpp
MRFNKLALIAVCLSCLLQSGCTDKKKIEELENANQSLRAENQTLRNHLDETSKKQVQIQQELEQAKVQGVAQRNEVSRLQAQNQETETKLAALTPPPTNATVMVTVKTPVTHEEFKAKVTGMTAEQLANYAGKPLDSSTNGPREYWDYDGITYDSVTGKSDRRVQVLLTNGRVAGVIFIP